MVLERKRYYKIKGTNNSGGTTPVGIKDINANGAYDVTNFAVANVNVPIPNGYIMPSGTLEVSENGTHNVKEYESVNVNVESGGTANGLPLEVDSLPSSGTAVPNSGYVENVYVNTSMSKEELVSLLSQLTYTDGEYIVANNSNDLFLMIINDEGMLSIMNGNTHLFAYIDGTTEIEHLGFSGWNPDFNGIVEANTTLVEGAGTQNDKLANLFSITPFGGSAGVEGAIYKVPTQEMVDLYIKSNENASGFYLGRDTTFVVKGCEVVETKPTSDIINSTFEEFYFYYVTSENDVFIYIDIGSGLMWVNASTLLEQNSMSGLSFKGTITYENEANGTIEVGYYVAMGSRSEYYLCENGEFIKLNKEVA